MHQTYIVTGMVRDERTLTLDEALPLKGGRVRVVVEAIGEPPTGDHARFMAEMRQRQQQRGHVPRSREEVDASLNAERDSWDD